MLLQYNYFTYIETCKTATLQIAQISKSYNKETIMTSNTNYLYKLNYINAPMLSLYLKEINQVKTGNSAK